MNAGTLLLGLGIAVTTFLLAGAASIELAPAAWGDSPGVGIFAVFVGFVVGLLAGGVVAVRADRVSRVTLSALVGYAALGVAFLAIAAMSYVNVPGVDEVFTFPVQLGVSLLVAIVVAILVGRGRVFEPVASA